ncbi:MAG: hypothetical protein KatS3mg003_1229 [Candidatus Nitrosocaldaceae archaeon]|nr:MAG: hypothetical protein KatS3mg003_1229 [Candidatus Nitrosocaldaceae archaeon]
MYEEDIIEEKEENDIDIKRRQIIKKAPPSPDPDRPDKDD